MTTPDFDPDRWEKSAFSGANGGCVEVNDSVPGVIGMRDSKNPEQPPFVFFPHEMDNFLRSVKAGQFDRLLL